MAFDPHEFAVHARAAGYSDDEIIAKIREQATPAGAPTPVMPATAPTEEPPGAVETFFRKASNAVSSNLVNPAAAGITHVISGQPYQDALKGINASDEAGSATHPIASAAGTVAGTGLQMAAPIPVPKGLSPMAAGAVTGGAFGAIGGAGDALNAGGSATDALTAAGKGGLGGAAVGGVVGGVLGKLVRGAPERVEDRIVANISRGEAGGAAKAKFADKVTKAATRDELMPELERTGLAGTVATQAAAKPGKVADKVTGVIDKYTTERLDPILSAIDKHGATPTGFDLKYQLLQLTEKLRSSGEIQQADHVERYEKFIGKAFKDDQKLTTTVLRKARNEVGLGNTFSSAEEGAASAGIAAKQAIYGAFNAAIEGAAAHTPGVDVASLRAANKTVSTLLSVRDALADRATKAAKGGTGIGHAIMGGVVRAGEATALGAGVLHALNTGDLGALTHVVEGIATAEAGKVLVGKVIPQAVRRGDYGLSRLELGARAGNAGASLARSAIEGGAARVIAPRVGRAVGSFLSPARDDK
jgi:hypothetical protein